MMTPNRAGHQRQWLHRQRSSLLPIWQRLVLGGYSALFGLILPLICWGATAEPGHPHRYPHFVFAEPQHNPAALPQAEHHATRHDMHKTNTSAASLRVEHEVDSAANPPAVCSLTPDSGITGRATPTLMLFSLLLLTFLGGWLMRRLDWPYVAFGRRLQFPKGFVLPVPLPPPRLSPLSIPC